MSTFTVLPDGELADWLIREGIVWPDNGFEIPAEKFDKLLVEAKRAHPTYQTEKQRSWALFQIIAKNRVSAQTASAIGDAATNDIAHWIRMSETQARGFTALRSRVEGLCDKMQGYCERQDAGVRETVDAVMRAGGLTAAAVTRLHEELQHFKEQDHALWQASREDRECEKLIAKTAENRRQLFLWAWRLALTALLCSFAWR